MAKKAQAESPQGKLHGQKFAFVGKFGYKDWDRDKYIRQATEAGAEVVDALTGTPDVLVVGEGRGGNPPSEVAKVQKKSPGVQIYDLSLFIRLLLPDREEILQVLSKGRQEEGHRYWDDLHQRCFTSGTTIDLKNSDLKNWDLYGAKLQFADLSGSDLRGATTKYTDFGYLEDVNFDGCKGDNVYLSNVKNCTFRKANLEKCWMFHGNGKTMEKCDFTAADMNKGRLERGTLTDCQFVDVDLSDAEMERSTFIRCDFTNANLSRAHLTESKLDGAIFLKANLNRADLRNTSLQRANLRNANLRDAVLNDADLTGADVTGADFQDAVLTGVKFDQVDVSKAKNLNVPAQRVAGPRLQELAAAAAGSKSFLTTAEVDLGKDEFAKLELWFGQYSFARSIYRREDNEAFDQIPAPTVEQGLLNLADRWPNATLRLDSIKVKGAKTLRGQKLLEVALAAWAEVFGVAIQSPDQLKSQKQSQQSAALKERDDLMLKIKKNGAKVWNQTDYKLRNRFNLQGIDLSGADLVDLDMVGKDLKNANFSGANLTTASLFNSQAPGANFSGANLTSARMQNMVLTGAILRDANLASAKITSAKLQGADFSGADLTETNFFKSQFDAATIFPNGFTPPKDLVWKGDGPRPGEKKKKIVAAKAGSLDFETFLKKLGEKVEAARLEKAGSMLKAERFQLFTEVKEDGLLGIVKSQSSNELVYSCRLDSTGGFGCCTQNLRPCGGLRGALCKHLLVLIVGLAKAGQLDPATVNHWVDLSGGKKPAIEEDSMSATFLRYKGAEAGEVDWRPTETIPEDFYAM